MKAAYKFWNIVNSETFKCKIFTLLLLYIIYRKSNADFEITKYENLRENLLSILLPLDTKDSTYTTKTEEIYKHDTVLPNMLNEADRVYKELLNTVKNIDKRNEKLKTKILTAELSLLTSLACIKAISEVSPIDHVEKYKLKAKYIREDIETFSALLSTYYIQGLVSGSITTNDKIETAIDVTEDLLKENKNDLKKVHPYCSILMEMKEKTVERIQKYASWNSFRPEEPTYQTFAKVRSIFYVAINSYYETLTPPNRYNLYG